MDFLQRYCVKDKDTGESQALIIATRYGNVLADRVFYATVPDPGPFKIGCLEYWQGKDTSKIIEDEAESDGDGDGFEIEPEQEPDEDDEAAASEMHLDPRVKRILNKTKE